MWMSRLFVAAIAFTLLAACGSEPETSPEVSDDAVFNKADVAFATDMIPHHAQALQMVDLTLGRELTPEVQALADTILAAQAPEIELMSDWLTDWDQPIPETPRDHANAEADHSEMEMPDMPGMMTGEEMAALEAATGPEFETMWLTSMMAHHEGAIEMAKTQQADGKFPEAIELAAAIEAGQSSEIALMQGLLK